MQLSNKRKQHVQSSTASLQAAISVLEQFTSKNQSASIVNVAGLAVKEGKLITTQYSLLREIAASLFSKKAREAKAKQKSQIQDIVMQAIDDVKRNYLQIEKLQNGTSEEKLLAAKIANTIKSLNAILDQCRVSLHWASRLIRFLCKCCGLTIDEDVEANRIEFPYAVRVHCNEEELTDTEEKIQLLFHANSGKEVSTAAVNESPDPLLVHERDLIRVKASTLLRQYGSHLKLASDALSSLRSAPISADLDANSHLSTLCLTLDVLPGTTFKVRGSFKRNPDSQTHSMPVMDSFKVSFQSTQSGFPHPMQYTGWALSEALVPIYPHRLAQLPSFTPIYNQKKEVARQLMAEVDVIERAKQLHHFKREIFSAHATELLQRHLELSMTILLAAPNVQDREEVLAAIDPYFKGLEQNPQAYDVLSETFQTMSFLFITKPHMALQKAWLEQHSALLNHDPKSCAQAAWHILEEEQNLALQTLKQEKEMASNEFARSALIFISGMGAVFASPAKSIIMQHWSETLKCAPPSLTVFDHKIQAAAYKQLNAFLEEIHWDLPSMSLESSADIVYSSFIRHLESDMNLFKSLTFEDVPHSLVTIIHELEAYFNFRYSSSIK